jgi:hypothetical protein
MAQSIAKDKGSAKNTFALALDVALGINNETQRAVTLRNVAIAQIQAGFSEDALRTAESILIDRNIRLTELATALAANGELESFKQLLIPCAYYLDAAYRIGGLLMRVYPNHVSEIANEILMTN